MFESLLLLLNGYMILASCLGPSRHSVVFGLIFLWGEEDVLVFSVQKFSTN